MIKYEYCLIENSPYGINQDSLNKRGKEGWEFVSGHWDYSTSYGTKNLLLMSALFKRVLQEEKTNVYED